MATNKNTELEIISDFELEKMATQINKSVQPDHPVFLEIHRRQKNKEEDDKQTQASIKNMTAIILILTLIILGVTCYTAFFSAPH